MLASFPDEKGPGSERFSNLSQVTEKPDRAYVVETPRPQSLTLTETLSLDERLRWKVTTPGDCGNVEVPREGSKEAYTQVHQAESSMQRPTSQCILAKASLASLWASWKRWGPSEERRKWSL